ncbi:hypothetical protein [Meiothermus hypogaeus]|uniref:Uncharacterized protein n=2 Tax=Meiothermus hypogaeus TaxID=884155 RepID=A0A511QWW2_9DEIN|nr:hypothetical protein [Meiothermus hypogaeus]RIH79223.1 hypothetical protein Mhypo_01221 [Meiothermus hypogaeus]GEM81869.1 hypothetical protein MHY01S_00350 [Meiothermus hypogaeus NBRC 106114]
MPERNTLQRGLGPILEYLDLPVEANTLIEAGNLVVLNAAGYAVHGSTATNLRAAGRAEQTVNNQGGAQGARLVRVSRGAFKWQNSSAADQITQADCLNDCFIVNSTTVAKTNGSNTRSRAGKVVGVEADGVWVETY